MWYFGMLKPIKCADLSINLQNHKCTVFGYILTL